MHTCTHASNSGLSLTLPGSRLYRPVTIDHTDVPVQNEMTVSADSTAAPAAKYPSGMNRRMGKNRFQAGFTLIEIMVVVVIIGMLVTLILPKVLDRQDQAAQVKATADIHSLSSAIKLYKLDNFKYPTTSQGLNALLSTGGETRGYVERLPKDPWGNDYQYQQPGQHMEFDVWSFGADGQSGGEGLDQDIGNWNMDEIR